MTVFAGAAALHAGRLLAHVLGVGLARHRHADTVRREGNVHRLIVLSVQRLYSRSFKTSPCGGL